MVAIKNNKKVVLFCPRSTLEVRHIGVPLSLLAIGTPLSKEGYDIKIIDGNIEDDYLDKIDSQIKDALCLGITSMTGPQIKYGLIAANFVKKKYPEVPIIWGGFHPTILPEQTLFHPAVDIVVRGQGEVTFKELIERLYNKASLDDVLGISYKENGKIITNPERPMMNLNSLPSLNYDLVDIQNYIVKTDYASRTLDYISSYGCPYKCSFCAEVFVNKRHWNALTSERVVDDIKNLVKRYNINGIRLADSSFFIDIERTQKICEGLIDSGLNIKWGNVNGRPNNLIKYDDEMWGLMKRSGLSDILIGAESGSQEALDFIDKEAVVEDTIRLKEICSKYNISLFVSMMIGIPYRGPVESKKNIKRDLYSILDLINQLQSIDNRHFIAIFIYTPFPGTPMYELSLKYGVREPQSLEEWGQIDMNTTNLPWVSRKYERVVKHLTQFIFLYTTAFYEKHKQSHFHLIHLIFHYSALLRMRYRFFAIPIEYSILKLHRKLNKNKNLLIAS